MKKMKGVLKRVLSFALALGMCLSLVACRPYPWEVEEKRIFDAVNEVSKHPDYVLCNDYEYRSAEKSMFFEDVIKEKLKEDGKIVEEMDGHSRLYLNEPNTLDGAFVAFAYNYRTDGNMLGFNRYNRWYAVGSLYLDDYSFSIHYFRFPYNEFRLQKVSPTQFCCQAVEYLKDEKKSCYLLIDRESGKTETKNWADFKEMDEEFVGVVFSEFNHATYTENGTVYTINTNYLDLEEGEAIRCPEYEYVLERCETLQEIDEIIGGATNNSVKSAFASNGTELFVYFKREQAMFGYSCDLPAVIFRCDTTFEIFEYIGMMYRTPDNSQCLISIIKTN